MAGQHELNSLDVGGGEKNTKTRRWVDREMEDVGVGGGKVNMIKINYMEFSVNRNIIKKENEQPMKARA